MRHIGCHSPPPPTRRSGGISSLPPGVSEGLHALLCTPPTHCSIEKHLSGGMCPSISLEYKTQPPPISYTFGTLVTSMVTRPYHPLIQICSICICICTEIISVNAHDILLAKCTLILLRLLQLVEHLGC